MADPTLYLRRGTWRTRIRGKRVSTGCKVKNAALLRARELDREAADPVHAASKKVTVGDAITACSTRLRLVSPQGR